MADDPPQAQLREQFRELERRLEDTREELAAVKEQRPGTAKVLGLDTSMGRRQAMAIGILGGGAGLGALTAASQPAQADAVAADVGTQADPWQKVWAHAIESGDGADALSFDDAVAFDHEAVSSATTIGNVTVVLYDSSVAGFTLTIPSSLEINGMVVRFVDQGGSASSNNVTVENSSNTTIATIDADDSIFEVWWDGSNWLNNIFTERVDAGTVATGDLAFDAAQEPDVVANVGATYTVDLDADGGYQVLTMTDNTTFSFTKVNATDGQTIYLILKQDGTGSRTPSWPANVTWPDGGTEPSWSTAANAVDEATFTYDSQDDEWRGHGVTDFQ